MTRIRSSWHLFRHCPRTKFVFHEWVSLELESVARRVSIMSNQISILACGSTKRHPFHHFRLRKNLLPASSYTAPSATPWVLVGYGFDAPGLVGLCRLATTRSRTTFVDASLFAAVPISLYPNESRRATTRSTCAALPVAETTRPAIVLANWHQRRDFACVANYSQPTDTKGIP